MKNIYINNNTKQLGFYTQIKFFVTLEEMRSCIDFKERCEHFESDDSENGVKTYELMDIKKLTRSKVLTIVKEKLFSDGANYSMDYPDFFGSGKYQEWYTKRYERDLPKKLRELFPELVNGNFDT